MVRMTDLLKKAEKRRKSQQEQEQAKKEEKPFSVQSKPEIKKEVPEKKEASEKFQPPQEPAPIEKKETFPSEKEKIPQPEIKKQVPEKEEVSEKFQPPQEPAPIEKKETFPSEKEKTSQSESVEFSKVPFFREEFVSLREATNNQDGEKNAFTEKDAKELYSEILEFVKKIKNAYSNHQPISKGEFVNIGEKIVNNIISGSQELLKLVNQTDNVSLYRYYNAVNVSILAVEIGMAYKYKKPTLLDLAIVGLVHDLDLANNKTTTDKFGALAENEIKKMRNHPLKTATYFDNAFNFKKKMIEAILQHHERKQGQGYPSGLVSEDTNELAKIIGIADTYDAMIHSRPYKVKLEPHDAVIEIVSTGRKLFPNELVKAFISRVGLYPIGSMVQLNTGEIAKVIMCNSEYPLRPLVNIVMDENRENLKKTRIVDLQKSLAVYIKETVGEGKE